MSRQNWIWTDQAFDKEKAVLVFFRKSFEIEEEIDSPSFIKISADTRYRLYVNGTYVCTGPRKGDDKQWYYERIDINPYLKKGKNIIAVSVLRYPPIPYRGYRSAWRTATPGLIVLSENDTVPSTDLTWISKVAEEVSVDAKNREYIRLFQEETVYGSSLLKNWNKTECDESNWTSVFTYKSDLLSPAVAPLFMKEREIPLMYQNTLRFTNVHHILNSSFKEDDYNCMLKGEKGLTILPHTKETVDLLTVRLTTAYLELAVTGGKGSTIKLLASEGYSKEIMIDGRPALSKGDRLDYTDADLRGVTDEFHPCGYGTKDNPEIYEPFSFREFRLIRMDIETGDEPLTIEDFKYRETAYPLDVVASVETSDDSLRDIWKISENTLRMCMHETYEDCPGYEQLQYTMDTRSQILYTYCVSGDDRLAKAAIDDFYRSQRPDGLVAACHPTFKSNIIPGFSAYYALMLYDHMMYFGDKKFLRKYYPSVMKVCEFYISSLNEKDLFGYRDDMGYLNKPYWAYIDGIDEWPLGVPPVPQGKEMTAMSLLMVTLLNAAAKVGKYLGFNDVSKEYLEVSERVSEAIRKNCIGENGFIQDAPGEEMYSQFCQIFGVLNDIFEESEAKAVMDKTMNGTLAGCSLSVSFYQFRALEKTGLYDKYANTVLDRWRGMLKKNLSTCVEHDSSLATRSDCHAWSAVPLYEMISSLLGIKPASPGFETVKINPYTSNLSFAKGQMKTSKGMIKVNWCLENGKLKKEIELPEGMKISQ